MYARKNDVAEGALAFILDNKTAFTEHSKNKFYSAFFTLSIHSKYWDLFELNEDDPRLLKNRNALTAYCNYVIAHTPLEERTTSYRYLLISELIGSRLVEAILAGKTIQLPTPGWWLPTIEPITSVKNIAARIKAGKPEIDPGVAVLSNGEVVKVSDLKFTVLDAKRVVFRDARELAELCLATNNTGAPASLVAYRPETIALHSAIAGVTTQIQLTAEEAGQEQLDHDAYLSRIVHLVMEAAAPDIKEASKELYDLRDQIEQEVTTALELIESGASDSNLLTAVKSSQEKVAKALALKQTLGDYVSAYSYPKAIIALATDMLYTQAAESRMDEVIQLNLSRLIAAKKIFPLICPSAEERCLFNVCGGQASGKSKSIYEFKCIADTQCRGWRNVHKGGGDSMRALFLEYSGNTRMQPELFAQLTQAQAGYVSHNLIARKLKAQVEAKNAPHMFVEQIYVGQDKIDLGLMNGGKVFITVVSTEILGPQGAIERSYLRGQDIGRFENSRNILNYHRGSTIQLPDRIAENHGRSVYIKIVDNNVPLKDAPGLVAEIDCKKGEIVIHDREKLQKFIRKIAINIQATAPEEAYDLEKLQQATIEKYFSGLEKLYKIIIKDPLQPSLSISIR